MAAPQEKIFYEICHHAEKFPAVKDEAIQQDEEIQRNQRSAFSWLLLRGLEKVRSGCLAPTKATVENKGRSIAFSASCEYIAILFQNQVTILSKEDNFKHACGTFTAMPESKAFLYGVWVDHLNILVLSDSMDTLYLIESNGEELKRIPKNHLQATGKIVGLFVWVDQNLKTSDRYNIMVITSDCILHRVVVNGKNIAVTPFSSKSGHQKLRRQHALDITCSCFHQDCSMLILTGPTKIVKKGGGNVGLYSVSVWRFTQTSDLELICSSSQLRGVLSSPNTHSGPFFVPKVTISPSARHLAVLDLTQNLHVLTLEENLDSNCQNIVQISEEGRNTAIVDDIRDIEWWSKEKLMIAKTNGVVNIVEIPSFNNILEDVPLFSFPLLGRNQSSDGHAFVLETVFSDHLSSELSRSAEPKRSEDVPDRGKTSYPTDLELRNKGLGWKLVSLLECSASQKYKALINDGKYEAAHRFAIEHGLDKDEVFKSQWLHSDYTKEAIQNFLSIIKDQSWVLSECVDKVGSTVDSVHAILSYGLAQTEDYKFQGKQKGDSNILWRFRTTRLRFLQYADRLETFLGVNMGRFSSNDYAAFRRRPLNEIAIKLAESGKIGALNLLFKRHTYSLAPFILPIVSAFPETIPVHNYGQLLPGLSPQTAPACRDEDWVECQEMVSFIESHWQGKNEDIDLMMSTENMVKLRCGLQWPPAMEIIEWYKARARAIDKFSGQLENALSFVDIGQKKGIGDLRPLFEDIYDLYHVVFSGTEMEDSDLNLSLSAWEQLGDYEKFKIMLTGVNEDTVVGRLREMAIPFMHRKNGIKRMITKDDSLNGQSVDLPSSEEHSETFLVRWLKEIAEDNQLELCSVIIEEGCKDANANLFFRDETEMIEVGLHCIYTCTHTDKWGLMASLLSKLPRRWSRGKHSSVGYDDFSSREGFKRSLGRALGRSSSSVSSNSKLIMSPLFMDEEDSRGSLISTNHDVCNKEEKSMNASENLEKRLRLAEGHVEVGRLLTHYQVAKPIQFFLQAREDEKGVKHLMRLLLSKFGRRQPGRSDSDWATLWRDMQYFQEKAFGFLDTEYMLMEFCRGLLKSGKFSLARNYLRGIGSMGLAVDKAEMLVIQAAREYFFSASSLDSSEIWKAKECLDLLPNSKQVKAEADIIDAIIDKLPRLGVTLLPMQFRQIRDPMEIVKMAIMSQTGAYLKVEELIEVSRLLGLNSSEDIAVVEAAIAREAGATGDLQLAVDLCLVLVRKDHGPIWDLCAALGRGSDLDKMDLQSRKELLGFALSHCDEESVGELLHAWKALDLASQCEDLGKTLGKKVPTLSDQEALIASFPLKNREQIMVLLESTGSGYTGTTQGVQDEEEVIKALKEALSNCTENFNCNGGFDWDALLQENKMFLSFAAVQLPWLVELNRTGSVDPNSMPYISSSIFAKECCSLRARAASAILYWLASNDTVPKDNLITSIAKTMMEKPVFHESDVLGCSYLLNLLDSHCGVEVIEDALRTRKEYNETHSAMNIGLLYSSLQGFVFENDTPKQRRQLLHSNFWESHSTGLDCMDGKEKIETTFWKEWRSRIAEKQRMAQQARILEEMIPGIETKRFLSGDAAYIQSVIFSVVESVKMEKKSILSKGLMLANMYGVNISEVLIRHLSSLLVSEAWNNEDIEAEISGHWNELQGHAAELLRVLSSTVYPALDASNKQRLAYLYKILSSCYVHIKERLNQEHLLSVEHAGTLSGLKNELRNFLKTMITAGCSFKSIVQICFQGRPVILSDTDLNYMGRQKSVHELEERITSGGSKDWDILEDIWEGYMNALDSALWEIRCQTADSPVESCKLSSRKLCNVLSSLSAADYRDDEMKAFDPTHPEFVILEKIRHAVWSKVTEFAEDLQLPNQVRVYILEVLQCITGRCHMHAFGAWQDTLLPWHEWDAYKHLDIENLSGKENQSKVLPLRSNLVALKSKELISPLWPGVEVNGEDLLSVDSSVSLFRTLAANAVTKHHVLALVSLVKEWECLFENVKQGPENKQTEHTQKIADEQDNWSEEVEWDEGWEALEDLKFETDNEQNKVVSVDTYHICWEIILEKLIEQSQFGDVLQLLDEKCLNRTTVLLTKDEAHKLTAKLATLQPSMALKCALLLPYDSLWFEALQMVEDKLKESSILDKNGQESIGTDVLDDGNKMDYGLLALILSVGVLPSLAGNPKFVTIFSYMCAMLGQLTRLMQKNPLCMQKKEDQACFLNKHENDSLVFCSVACPFFIAELTRAKHYFLAGSMILQFMHVHPVFGSMEAVYVALKRYLEIQIKGQGKYQKTIEDMAFPYSLKNTANGLRDKLPSVLNSAFSTVSEDFK